MLVLGDSHVRAYGNNPNFTPIFLGPGRSINFIDWSNFDAIFNICKRINDEFTPKTVLFCLGEPDTRYALGLGWSPWISHHKPDEYNYDFLNKCAERQKAFFMQVNEEFGWNAYLQNIILTQDLLQCKYINFYNEKLSSALGEKFLSFNHRLQGPNQTINTLYSWDKIHANNKIVRFSEEFFNLESSNHSFIENDEMQRHLAKNQKFQCYSLISNQDDKLIIKIKKRVKKLLKL